MKNTKFLSMIMAFAVCTSSLTVPLSAYADESGTGTVFASDKKVDPAIIREMLNKFIDDNGFDARVAEPEEYPDEDRVVLEFSINNNDSINIKVIQFMTENGIDSAYNIYFVPVDNGVKLTTDNADKTKTTETTTTAADPVITDNDTENTGYPKTIERHISVEFRDDVTRELIPDTSINYWIDYSSHNKDGRVEEPVEVQAQNGMYTFDITADIYKPMDGEMKNTSGWLCVELTDISENYRDCFAFYNETAKYEIEVWENMAEDKTYTFYLTNNEEWEKLKVSRYGEGIENINEYTAVTTTSPSEIISTTTIAATTVLYNPTTIPEYTTTDPNEAVYPYNSKVSVYVSVSDDDVFQAISGVEFELYMHYYDDPADVITSLGKYTTGDKGFEDDILIQAEKPCEIGFNIISTPEKYSKGYKSIVYPCDLFKRNPVSNKLILSASFKAESTVSGDANGDYEVTISDIVAILQYSANKQKYPIEEQYLNNADCYDPGSGVNAQDAYVAQQYDAKEITSLPQYIS